ncbi:DUF2975 domain-containing protein [Bosea sp. NPDC055332]
MTSLASPAQGRPAMVRLRRVSTVARILCVAAAALMAFGAVWLWHDPEQLVAYARTIGVSAPIGPLSERGYWSALTIGLVPAGLFVAAMLRLASLFGRFGRGQVLEEENAQRLTRVGWLLIAMGVATPLTRGLQSVALTFDNPSGQKQLAITLDPGMFGALAAGAALVAFGLVLREAVRLADENKSFV